MHNNAEHDSIDANTGRKRVRNRVGKYQDIFDYRKYTNAQNSARGHIMRYQKVIITSAQFEQEAVNIA